MSSSSFASLQWLRTFLPNFTSLQEKIFLQWVETMCNYYVIQTNESNKTPSLSLEKFLLKKTLRFFVQDYFMLSPAFTLPDLEQAIQIFHDALPQKDSTMVVLYGDRDADGIMSTSILYLFLRDIVKWPEKNLLTLTPRENDKYGITEDVAEHILSFGPDILITLDCGSSNKDTMQYIKDKKDMVIFIIDHHFIPAREEDFPHVDAFINPKRLPILDTNREMCTAGLVFKFVWAFLYSYSKEYHYINQIEGKETNFRMFRGIETREGIDSQDINRQRTICFSSNSKQDANTFDGDALWLRLIQSNSYFKLINTLLEYLPEKDRLIEKVNMISSYHMPKIYNHLVGYLPLAALGVVADIMPLVDDNRILVAEGLKVLSHMPSKIPIGLKAMLHVSKIPTYAVNEESFSFNLCPMINAAGRLGRAEIALQLFGEKDELSAYKIAAQLRKINEERKSISNLAVDKVISELNETNDTLGAIIFCYDKTMHRGISGLVANKLSDFFKKPSMVLVDDGDVVRGSVRSYQQEDVFSFMLEFKQYFIQYGGHRQAAGFSISYAVIDEFIFALQKIYQEQPNYFNKQQGDKVVASVLEKDEDVLVEVNDTSIKHTLWEEAQVFSPFGMSNPLPTISVKLTQYIDIVEMGKQKEHIRIILQAIPDKRIEAVWFFYDKSIQNITLPSQDNIYKLHVKPSTTFFMGKRKLQLKVKCLVTSPK